MVVLTDSPSSTRSSESCQQVWSGRLVAHQPALLGACLGTCLRGVPSIHVALRLCSLFLHAYLFTRAKLGGVWLGGETRVEKLAERRKHSEQRLLQKLSHCLFDPWSEAARPPFSLTVSSYDLFSQRQDVWE